MAESILRFFDALPDSVIPSIFFERVLNEAKNAKNVNTNTAILQVNAMQCNNIFIFTYTLSLFIYALSLFIYAISLFITIILIHFNCNICIYRY